MGWNRKQGMRNKDFKKVGKLGQEVVKKSGGDWNPLGTVNTK